MSTNRLIESLPEESRARLLADLEEVTLEQGEVLMSPNERIPFAYFPTSAMLSQVNNLEDGHSIEVMLVGRNGFTGLPLLLGGSDSDFEILAQMGGSALRIEPNMLTKHLHDPLVRDALNAFGRHIIHQSIQSVACAAFHEMPERLARWLLLARDATELDELPLTHEFIAILLGVHRTTVSVTVRFLETAGLISQRRGSVRLLDIPALREAACECYRS